MLAVAQRDTIKGFTTELTVRYPRPVPTETEIEFTGWIEFDDGRRATRTRRGRFRRTAAE